MDEVGTSLALRRRSPLPFTGVSGRKRAVFYTQLARMLRAGLSPVRSLTTLAGQRGSGRLRRAASDMVAHIQAGGTLAEAFARHPNLFPANEVRMVEAAELGGSSPDTMERIAGALERLAAFWRKLSTGLIYPGFVLVAAFFGVPLFLTFLFGAIVPGRSAIPLPLPFLGGDVVDVAIREAAFVVGAVAAGLVVVTIWRWLSSTSWPRVVIDGIVLHLPVFGKLSRRLALARFADSFACLYSAGVLVPEAMARAAMACGNAVLARRILKAAPLLAEGGSVKAALGLSGALPPMALNMVEVGEEAGKLDEALDKVADYEQQDAQVTIDRLAKVLPMLAIFAMVLIMGYMILSMWASLYQAAFDRIR